MMNITPTSIAGAYYWEPSKREDSRGYFYRGFCRQELMDAGVQIGEIVQINHSFSTKKGTFRGFHYQLPPFAEEKIIACLEGKVCDFILDLRKGSETFLKNEAVVLSEKNNRAVLIPKGCAHGFITLTENCRLLYLHTAFYKPEYERGIAVSDPRVGVELPMPIEEISERDQHHPLLTENFEGIQL
jgi:dTDP-4-dehydrorhamnose 3,5-epimerase